MWSRAHETIGVSLLSLDGRVVATVPNVILFDPANPSGQIILRSEDEKRYWQLDVSAHELVPVTLLRANKLHRYDTDVPAATPAGSVGSWAWSIPAPSGMEILAQYYQNGYGSQLSECAQPLAMIQPAPGLNASPVTGEPLGAASSSYALGWTPAKEPMVAVTGTCGAPSGGLRDGVYIFDKQGTSRRVEVPKGSYYFQMWSSAS